MGDKDNIEEETYRKYSGSVYKPETISLSDPSEDGNYSERMLRLKLDLISRYLHGEVIVDLCCGSGVHLYETAKGRRLGIGLDFSEQFIDYAMREAKMRNIENVDFICCNAKKIPISSRSVDAIYSLSSLHYIPDVYDVISEISRILIPGGRCLLDLGNERSLNGIVVRHYPELSQLCGLRPKSMLSICEANGLRVIEHRSFQILPMWADKPRWLWPALHPIWQTILSRRVGGRMLDEWISSMPVLRHFAFRHILVCEKMDT